MAQTMINFRMDSKDKNAMEVICEKLGMNMTTAFKIFAKKVIHEQRIPFEVSLNNNFEDLSNIHYLENVVSEIDSGKTELQEHDLIEV